MRISLILFLVMLLASCGQRNATPVASSHEEPLKPESSPTVSNNNEPMNPKSLEELLHATAFGFGLKLGQKVERSTDIAFMDLISSNDVITQSKDIFEKGNACAKLYALLAIHGIDHSLFEKMANKMNQDEVIFVQDGCSVGSLPYGKIISQIMNGRYEDMIKYFNSNKAEPNPTRNAQKAAPEE
jgi:hypothetical protein